MNINYTGCVPFIVYLILWAVLGFLLGSVPFGIITARLKGINLRQVGSGNIGATNVARALGWGWGGTVLVLDALKGVAAIVLLNLCLSNLPAAAVPTGGDVWLRMLVALTAILGHTFSPWLRFRGGKGVATALGVAIAMFQLWLVPALVLFVLVVLTTRYISLGSLLAALFMCALSLTLLATGPVEKMPDLGAYWPFTTLAALLVIITHRSNINRLYHGTENRIGAKPLVAPDAATANDAQDDS